MKRLKKTIFPSFSTTTSTKNLDLNGLYELYESNNLHTHTSSNFNKSIVSSVVSKSSSLIKLPLCIKTNYTLNNEGDNYSNQNSDPNLKKNFSIIHNKSMINNSLNEKIRMLKNNIDIKSKSIESSIEKQKQNRQSKVEVSIETHEKKKLRSKITNIINRDNYFYGKDYLKKIKVKKI